MRKFRQEFISLQSRVSVGAVINRPFYDVCEYYKVRQNLIKWVFPHNLGSRIFSRIQRYTRCRSCDIISHTFDCDILQAKRYAINSSISSRRDISHPKDISLRRNIANSAGIYIAAEPAPLRGAVAEPGGSSFLGGFLIRHFLPSADINCF